MNKEELYAVNKTLKFQEIIWNMDDREIDIYFKKTNMTI